MTLTLDDTQAKALLQLLNGRHQYNAGLDPVWMRSLDTITEQVHGAVVAAHEGAQKAHAAFLAGKSEPENTKGFDVETPSE
jgi:hypothetical protein